MALCGFGRHAGAGRKRGPLTVQRAGRSCALTGCSSVQVTVRVERFTALTDAWRARTLSTHRYKTIGVIREVSTVARFAVGSSQRLSSLRHRVPQPRSHCTAAIFRRDRQSIGEFLMVRLAGPLGSPAAPLTIFFPVQG